MMSRLTKVFLRPLQLPRQLLPLLSPFFTRTATKHQLRCRTFGCGLCTYQGRLYTAASKSVNPDSFTDVALCLLIPLSMQCVYTAGVLGGCFDTCLW